MVSTNLKNMRKAVIPPCQIVRKIEVDWKLLKNLLYYRTHSRDKEIGNIFRSYLYSELKKIPTVVVEEDKIGNMYITKGDADLYPCIVAHQDINQWEVENVQIVQTSKLIFGIDKDTGLQCGLGLDDKAGIYLAFHLLRKFDNLKVFFPVDEEIGGVGSHAADMTFFEDCSFLLQGDRNSWANDVSYTTNGEDVVSEVFVKRSMPVLNKYNYAYAYCMYTDIGILAPKAEICGVNISIGYFDEHYDIERLSIPHFMNAIAFAEELVETMQGERWNNIYIQEDNLDYYHSSPGWNFTKEDDVYVQESLATGECPMCLSNRLEPLATGTITCLECDSYYNIKKKEKEIWF